MSLIVCDLLCSLRPFVHHLLIQPPIIRLVTHFQIACMFFNKSPILSIIQESGDEAQARTLVGSEIRGVPLEDGGQGQAVLRPVQGHAAGVDEGFGRGVQFPLQVVRGVDVDERAGSGAAHQGEVDAGVQGLDDVFEPGVLPPEPPEEGIGRPPVAPEHPVLHVVGAEKVAPHLVIHPLKKVPDLFHRIPDSQGDDPVDNDDVIEVDPERGSFFPAGQKGQVHGLQVIAQLPVRLIDLRFLDALIGHPHPPGAAFEKPGFEAVHALFKLRGHLLRGDIPLGRAIV